MEVVQGYMQSISPSTFSVSVCLSVCLSVSVSLQSIIDYGSTLWDTASANTLKLLVSLHNRAFKAILLKKHNPPPPPPPQPPPKKREKKRLNYNKGVLIHKITSGKVPPSLTAEFFLNQL